MNDRKFTTIITYFRSESDHHRDKTALKVNNFHLLD